MKQSNYTSETKEIAVRLVLESEKTILLLGQ